MRLLNSNNEVTGLAAPIDQADLALLPLQLSCGAYRWVVVSGQLSERTLANIPLTEEQAMAQLVKQLEGQVAVFDFRNAQATLKEIGEAVGLKLET